MNKIHKRRMIYLSFFVIGLIIACSLIFYALKQNLNVFVTPKDLATRHFPPSYHFRLGGMVKKGSIKRESDSLNTTFIVTDLRKEILVCYVGILPDLFAEERGVIVEGELNHTGLFMASRVLAKHDENYMPKNVYQALRRGTS